VHGGQQPIVGATIQLYAVGTSGSKSASTALIGSTVTTGSNGSFSLPAYSCGTSTDVYLVATGGDSGSGANGAISLMAALGSCTSSLTLPYVQVNELTTVASVYALAPFMADYAHVGAANTTSAQTGISNAFATVNNLVSVTSGSAPGAALPAGATVPTAELNTLADILAACVNTSGSTSSGCSSLLTATGATETIGAALGIANHPGTAVSTLYPLATPASPFQPTLSAAPNDFTVAIKFSGNGLATPYGVALDANGRVWVANESGNSVTRLSNAGAPAGNYTGVLAPRAIAIDKLGNAWVANTSQSNVVEISALGTPIGTFTAGGINAPESIAIDSGNQVWVANGNGNSITSLNSLGVATNGSPLTGSGNIVNPAGIALDPGGNVWVSSTGLSNVAKFSNAGALLSGAGYTDQSLLHPQGIALDASGNAYVAANYISGVSAFSNNGTALAASPYGSPGLPVGVAIDGSGAVWVTNATSTGSLVKLVGSANSTFGSLNTPVALAVDESGNIWTANSGDNTISEFVGVAVPVVTPLAATVGP
jgi:streptogramin lyase